VVTGKYGGDAAKHCDSDYIQSSRYWIQGGQAGAPRWRAALPEVLDLKSARRDQAPSGFHLGN
jgi:hypothetical protein